VVHGAVVGNRTHRAVRRRDHHSADGCGRSPDAKYDDGVCGAAASSTTTAAAAAGAGRSAKIIPVTTNPNAAPTEAPKEIVPEVPAATGVSEGVPGGVEGGIPGGTLGGVVGGLPSAPPPPPPPPTAPVRVGGNIKAPNKVRHVNPVYPPIAQSARVQGIVIVEATIGPDGRVKDAKVLRSIPLLDQAALDAVKQWQFTPTLLNGVPVPVIMTVTVNFTLQ
jgi:periplasmic protein TonB